MVLMSVLRTKCLTGELLNILSRDFDLDPRPLTAPALTDSKQGQGLRT